MAQTRKNGVATAADFQAAARVRGEIHEVELPSSHLKVKLRRPSPIWLLFHGVLPASLAARVQAGGSVQPQNADDLRALAKWIAPLLEEVFVSPRLSLDPGPGEISPELLSMEDAGFVIRWAVGELSADGRSDLAEGFRGSRGASATGGPGS